MFLFQKKKQNISNYKINTEMQICIINKPLTLIKKEIKSNMVD